MLLQLLDNVRGCALGGQLSACLCISLSQLLRRPGAQQAYLPSAECTWACRVQGLMSRCECWCFPGRLMGIRAAPL